MSAPKRIWARWLEFPEGMSGEGGRRLMVSDSPIEGYTPFVRADIVVGLAEAAKESAPFIKNAFFKNWVEQALAAMDQH